MALKWPEGHFVKRVATSDCVYPSSLSSSSTYSKFLMEEVLLEFLGSLSNSMNTNSITKQRKDGAEYLRWFLRAKSSYLMRAEDKRRTWRPKGLRHSPDDKRLQLQNKRHSHLSEIKVNKMHEKVTKSTQVTTIWKTVKREGERGETRVLWCECVGSV